MLPVIPEPRRREDCTHYTQAEEPVTRYGWTTAVCGFRVNEFFGTDIDLQAPTCPWCKAWLDERNHDA